MFLVYFYYSKYDQKINDEGVSNLQTQINTLSGKLPFKLGINSGSYGYYRNDNNTFVGFKSQADVDSGYQSGYNAGVSAGKTQGISEARKGTATATQVLTGYTFTNSTSSGISGSMPNRGTIAPEITPGNLSATPGAAKYTSNNSHDYNNWFSYTLDAGYYAANSKVWFDGRKCYAEGQNNSRTILGKYDAMVTETSSNKTHSKTYNISSAGTVFGILIGHPYHSLYSSFSAYISLNGTKKAEIIKSTAGWENSNVVVNFAVKAGDKVLAYLSFDNHCDAGYCLYFAS